ncbi:hypothetical protein CC78DRAFT_444121, partial [Lojkania enalia]
FEFIHSNTPGTLLATDRSLIRSRCMQGKNKREGSRRSTREKRRKALEASQKGSRDLVTIVPVEVERPLPNLSGLMSFANALDARAHSMLNEAFAHTMVNHSLSSLDICANFESLDRSSFHWLFQDGAFLHSVLCARFALHDLKGRTVADRRGIQPSRTTRYHFRETLLSLAKKLDRDDAYKDEVVVYVVLTLTIFAALFDDWDAVAKHIAGLKKIVVLRGGWSFLQTRPALHFKLDRLDLAWSLSSGKALFFLPHTMSWDPMLCRPATFLASMYDPPAIWDHRLVVVFRDFQYLVFAINESICKHARYQASCFQNMINSLQTRLMYLSSQLSNSTAELIRLSLLAFLATTLKVPGRKMPFPWITDQLRKAYTSAAMPGSPLKGDIKLHLWVIFVAAISVFDTNEPWLLEAWSPSWQEWHNIKQQLMRVMWIETIHDKLGERVFEYLRAH